MAFTKIILEFPSEGFTGETVKHTITKANLKNQPDLADKGIKVGDEVEIVKPVVEAPLTGDSAATKKTTETKAKVTAKAESTNEEVPAKGNRKRAAEIATAQSLDVVYEDHNGDFYTSKNLVLLSVGQDKTKVITHNF